MITTSTQWDSLCQRPGQEVTVVVRMYYGDESAYKSFANRELTIGTEKFLGVIQGVPTVIQQLDMKEHTHSIQSLTLRINNLEYWPGKRWSDLVEDTALGAGADIGFYNRKIDIRLYLDGITTFANCFPLLSNGIVREIKHSREQTAIEIEDRTGMAYQDIGTYLADTDAADTAQGLPEDSYGKIKPNVYGGHTFLKANDSKASDTSAVANNMIPCIYLGVDSSNKYRWFVTEHKVDELSLDEFQHQLWGIDSQVNRFVRISSIPTIEQNSASGCIISHTTSNNLEYYDYFYAKGVPTVTNSGNSTETDFTPVANVIDKDFTSKATGILSAAATTGDWIQIDIPFPVYENQDIADADITLVRTYIYWELILGGGGNAADWTVRIDGSVRIDPIGASYPDARYTTNTGVLLTDIAEDIAIKLSRVSELGGGNATLDIYEVYKGILYKPRKVLPIYFVGKGYEYDTWINDRAVVDGYTEEHEDHDANANAAASPPVDEDLIENFAGVIESVLRDLLLVTTANIDEDSFNIASNNVPTANYKCSTSITERTNSLELLFSLCKNGLSWLWWQPDGTIKMKVMELTYGSSHLDRTIDARDVTNLKFDRTPISDIKTAVDVRYNLSQGKYMSATGISEDTDQQSKYNITEAQSTLICEAKHIGDNTTAGNFRLFLLNFFKQPHNIAIGTVDKMHLDLDLGDIIELSNMPYKVHGEDITANATRNGQTIYKYWWIFHVERSDKLRFKAIQLHRLTSE